MIGKLWLALVALGLTTCAAMSAEAALRAIARHPSIARDVPDPIPAGYEADDHFPGAALLYAGPDAVQTQAAPAAGVTGTTDLPDLPVPAAAEAAYEAAGPVGIVAASPFRLGRTSAVDRGRALECLTAAIYYEAATEPDAGQRAVAQVILNRVRHPAFPASVCGVVYQGSERAGCQFSFACDGAMQRVPQRAAWQRAARVAAAALAGYVFAPVGLATHYHTYAVTPAWNRSLVMTDAVGAHFFHRWKGYWGSAAAFRQPYSGMEPMPGPHVPTTTMLAALALPMPVALPVLGPAAPSDAGATRAVAMPVTPAATIRDDYATSGQPIAPARRGAAPVRPDPEAGESQILEKWKDSGQPLL